MSVPGVRRPMRLAILASHVIQYQAPFFRALAKEPDIDLTVIYCSRAGLETYLDHEMSTTLRWDIDLLEGYDSVFLRNFGRGTRYSRLANPGVIPTIVRGHFDAVILFTGWGSITALLAVAACRASDTPFFLYGDSSHPPPVATLKERVRDYGLRAIFRLASGFMVSGTLNGDYYAHYGADRRRFFLLPWAIDNDRFANAPPADESLRLRYDIRPGRIILIFSAKLLPRKDPATLLRAVGRMHARDMVTILFLGDGELRAELERLATELRVNTVFAGFVNQSSLPAHYRLGDAFVLPSLYEPRGAVINEAMACGLPIVVTDRCGSIGDIVQPGENAFVYPAGDDAALAAILDLLVSDPALRKRMSIRSREIIDGWSYQRGVEGVRMMLQSTAPGGRA